MKKLNRGLRLSGLFLLIILASFGMGLTGGVPPPRPTRKEESIEIVTEEEEVSIDDRIDLKREELE